MERRLHVVLTVDTKVETGELLCVEILLCDLLLVSRLILPYLNSLKIPSEIHTTHTKKYCTCKKG